MSTTEIIKKSYRVNGKEYTVGQEVALPKRLQKRLLEIKEASKRTDDTLEQLYSAMLLDPTTPSDEELTQLYFIQYQGANAERLFLTGQINRDLYEHFGGFVPVKLELVDEPRIVVREFEKDEANSVTPQAVRSSLGIDLVAAPAVNILRKLDQAGNAVISPIYPAWRSTGAMVFTATMLAPMDMKATAEEFKQHPTVRAVVSALEDISPTTNIPYAVISVGHSTVITAINPSVDFTADFANNIYGVTLSLSGGSKDAMSVLNVFAEVNVVNEKPQTVVSIMMHRAEGPERTSCAARYLRENGKLTFLEFWDAEAIVRRASELSAKK